MSNKPENIPIENKFSPTFDIQQNLNTINQQNIANAKFDDYASQGLNLGKTESTPLKQSVRIGDQTVGGRKKVKILKGGNKPKLCKKTEERIKEDVKICNFHPDDFYFRGKWKGHEIYVDTKDKSRAAKQIYVMFANQMDMKKFKYELVNEKNGKKSIVKGYVNEKNRPEITIIRK